MNARLESEMGQLERWKKRRESSAGTGDGDRLSPIVRDALREALRVERNCERLFSVFNPSTPGDAFAVSPEGTPRFSQGGGRGTSPRGRRSWTWRRERVSRRERTKRTRANT